MNYTCTAFFPEEETPTTWNASLDVISRLGSFLELRFRGRGSSLHAIVGPQINGHFICIPNYDIGSELAEYQDAFLNRERLTPLIGEVDAITVAQGLAALARATE